uniref:Uncharacterized protein n=1 Tax=Leersia perrieri TaxID=77586 RepID=A0A0D9V1G3_9ORYZ
MRREGRQHGRVHAYDRAVLQLDADPAGHESKRRVVGAVAAPATVANGGFVRAPRKPTNHSKFTGGRSYRALSGKAGAAGSSSSSCNKGRRKVKHDELKVYYLEEEVDGRHDLDGMHTDQKGFMMPASAEFMRGRYMCHYEPKKRPTLKALKNFVPPNDNLLGYIHRRFKALNKNAQV